MTFENFYAGNSYSYEVEAAKSVADQPGGERSPFIICGPCGVGKSHLLSAIHFRMSALPKNYNIIYTSANDIVEELIASIQEGKSNSFREKYCGADVLLIDNFELLSEKEYTQEELFNIFDFYAKNNKQIVLCVSGHPSECDFAQKIKSRLSCGIVLNMALPNNETKIAIIDGVAKEWNLELDTQIVHCIAEKMNTASEIKGVLKNIKMDKEINNRYPSLDDLKNRIPQLQ